MSVSVTLRLSRLRRVISGEKAALDRGAKAYAEAVKELATQLAPYDPENDDEHLRDTGEVVPGDKEGAYKVQFGRGLPDARAIYQEFGTRYMAAQPYLAPATRHTNPLPFFANEMRELIR